MREAILSGWKGSKSSGFSPMPQNLMGFPVTALMESAAPPRVVAIELCHDDAGDAQLLIERL